jgi:Zn-dependent protease with chaperone function
VNFFEAQDRAHRKTGMLIGLLIAGLVAMTVGLYAVFMLCLELLGVWEEAKEQRAAEQGQHLNLDAAERFAVSEIGVWWSPQVLAVTFGVILVLVGGGFLYRYLQLRRGGEAVAEMLGGVRIEPDTPDAAQRRALNVVEEMAIASGVPVPPVFELPDDSINAFAAGHTVDQAAVGLTRGCIALPREELQGVVAHEFSHIFNGDMRLNLRLVAVINGVMVLGLAGLILARYVGLSLLMSGNRRDDKGAGIAVGVALMILGWLVAAIGFTGTLVARIIQAAVSRQREFLADASAVQYTRNPSGIGGALARIQHESSGFKASGEASQFNHMFFSQAVPALFATHPPLSVRIERITSGQGIEVRPEPSAPPPPPTSSQDRAQVGAATVALGRLQAAVAHAGELTQASMDWTGQVMGAIPEPLRQAAREPSSVRALIAAMLMHEGGTDEAALTRQRQAVAELLPPEEAKRTSLLLPLAAALPTVARVPLLDLTSAAVQSLSTSQRGDLGRLIDQLVAADQTVSRFEWVVSMIVDAMLDRGGEASHSASAKLEAMPRSVEVILTIIATAGTEDGGDAVRALNQGLVALEWDEVAKGSAVSQRELATAVHELRTLRFAERRRLLEVSMVVVNHDGETTIEEAEMIRAIAEVLAVPMPMVVPTTN